MRNRLASTLHYFLNLIPYKYIVFFRTCQEKYYYTMNIYE
ncbi:hypothetical protein HMPREF3221_00957 [Fusobacterium nucleatum]|uniref:Uncharacterized protein n=1 Tax=Fusobacterium nucleatum TaxID=851 RepID=A0A133P159_FUSNU|nr:hypothetical protein HMPREF3221_00957 [Fusobacterium nucleatum]